MSVPLARPKRSSRSMMARMLPRTLATPLMYLGVSGMRDTFGVITTSLIWSMTRAYSSPPSRNTMSWQLVRVFLTGVSLGCMGVGPLGKLELGYAALELIGNPRQVAARVRYLVHRLVEFAGRGSHFLAARSGFFGHDHDLLDV